MKILTLTLSLEKLSEILNVSEIRSSVNHAGMLAHEIIHPEFGVATTVQSGDGGLLMGFEIE